MFGVPTSGRRPPSWRSRSAFTLIELLIVIAIIGVLTAMSLSLLAGASNDAKISATQARMSQITAILQLQMEDYEVRRLPIPNRILAAYVASNRIEFDGNTVPGNDRLQLKYLRRQILMDIINSEMPRPIRRNGTGGFAIEYGTEDGNRIGVFDAAENNALVDQGTGAPVFPSTALVPNIGNQIPDFDVYPSFPATDTSRSFGDWLGTHYGTIPAAGAPPLALRALLAQVRPSSVTRWARFAGNVAMDDNQILPAEYLYCILATIQIDGQSAVELLGGSAVADTDDDGNPEVVDAWGDPMVFDVEQAGWDIIDNVVSTNAADNFVPLDPRVPRALDELRFVVGSTRIPESLPGIERASRGVQ